MNKFKTFLSGYDVTTHTIAVFGLGAIAAFYEVPQFNTLVMSIYNPMPTALKSIVVAGFALYAWYRNGQKPVAVTDASLTKPVVK